MVSYPSFFLTDNSILADPARLGLAKGRGGEALLRDWSFLPGSSTRGTGWITYLPGWEAGGHVAYLSGWGEESPPPPPSEHRITDTGENNSFPRTSYMVGNNRIFLPEDSHKRIIN